MMLLSAVHEERGELQGYSVGVGPVNAAATAMEVLLRERPSHVVLMGTAGAYRGGPAIGEVVCGGRLGWGDGTAALGLGYVPAAPTPLEAKGLPRSWGLDAVPVLTLAAISSAPELVAALSDGWQVEHMETFAVATACARLGIPFDVVLGITNEVGPDAHAQWLANRAELEARVQDLVRRNLPIPT